MAYIGNTAEQQAFTPAIDYFNGNGSTTAFTLSRPVASVAQVQATIENVPQNPSDAYTVSGNIITFTSAPPSGINNIYVYYTSPITTVITPGYGTVGTAQLQSGVVSAAAVSDQNNTSTGYFDLPSGTTAQRPGSPTAGMIRYNTTESALETYNGTSWVQITTAGYPYSVDVLVVAGGGAALYASGSAGGSGGGGYLEGSMSLGIGTAYPVTIGAGGAGTTTVNTTANNGSNSVFNSATALGGGTGSGNGTTGSAGGSGGGAGGLSSNGSNRPNTAATQGNSGGLTGYGNTGGSTVPSTNFYAGSGGGGAGAVGANFSGVDGGAGGAGRNWQSLGTFYAGGGGGGTENGSGGAGGSGGGGAGGTTSVGAGSGSENTGGGAGGITSTFGGAKNGGSGIVIIRYLGAQRGTGGTVTSAGGYTYHTFTSSGTYTA
jgi:hypothetical protein